MVSDCFNFLTETGGKGYLLKVRMRCEVRLEERGESVNLSSRRGRRVKGLRYLFARQH